MGKAGAPVKLAAESFCFGGGVYASLTMNRFA
jgi:hypothetical protein